MCPHVALTPAWPPSSFGYRCAAKGLFALNCQTNWQWRQSAFKTLRPIEIKSVNWEWSATASRGGVLSKAFTCHARSWQHVYTPSRTFCTSSTDFSLKVIIAVRNRWRSLPLGCQQNALHEIQFSIISKQLCAEQITIIRKKVCKVRASFASD